METYQKHKLLTDREKMKNGSWGDANSLYIVTQKKQYNELLAT